jgi:integrase
MITIRTVQALRQGGMIWDAKLPGFGARRQREAVSYILKYRVNGIQRFITLGRHGVLTPDAARRKAKTILGAVAGGNDPASRRSDATGAVIGEYLAWAEPRQRKTSFRHTTLYLRNHWRSLHRLPILAVKRRDVARALTEIEAKHTASVADSARTALSAFFSWAIREGYDLVANPVAGTHRYNGKARGRVLSEAELAAIWRSCDDSDYGRIVRLLILSGQRREEIGGLRWEEVDIARAVILLPAARVKNKRDHILPLTPQAQALLPPICGDWVFGRKGFVRWSANKAALDAASGVSGWRLHDVRRTVATMLGDKLGVLPHITEAILNHYSGHRAGVAGIYNRARYEDEMRNALQRWADYVYGAAAGAQHN